MFIFMFIILALSLSLKFSPPATKNQKGLPLEYPLGIHK